MEPLRNNLAFERELLNEKLTFLNRCEPIALELEPYILPLAQLDWIPETSGPTFEATTNRIVYSLWLKEDITDDIFIKQILAALNLPEHLTHLETRRWSEDNDHSYYPDLFFGLTGQLDTEPRVLIQGFRPHR